uniref:Ig-like domain-containing protein n=1 Tax=Oreochromis aureus TaxID=47969 RepID=A0AAZ1XPG0_OREAU
CNPAVTETKKCNVCVSVMCCSVRSQYTATKLFVQCIQTAWSRADLGDEYVFVYRDGRFVPDSQHPSFKNRVDLQDRQMKDGDVSLVLKNVTTADDGSYNCNIFNGGTTSWEKLSVCVIRAGFIIFSLNTAESVLQSQCYDCYEATDLWSCTLTDFCLILIL